MSHKNFNLHRIIIALFLALSGISLAASDIQRKLDSMIQVYTSVGCVDRVNPLKDHFFNGTTLEWFGNKIVTQYFSKDACLMSSSSYGHSVTSLSCAHYCDNEDQLYSYVLGSKLGIIDVINSNEDSSCVTRHHHKSKSITALACSFDNKLIATSDDRGQIIIWTYLFDELKKGSLKEHLVIDDGHYIVALAFFFNSDFLLIRREDNKVILYDIALKMVVSSFQVGEQYPFSQVTLPSGTLCAKAKDNVIGLYYPDRIKWLSGHENTVSCCAYSASKKYLVSGSLDKTVRLWDCESATCLFVGKAHERVPHTVGFSLDDKWVYSISQDQEIIIWRLVENQLYLSSHSDKCCQYTYRHAMNSLVPSVLLTCNGNIKQSIRLKDFIDPRFCFISNKQRDLIMRFVEEPGLSYKNLLKKEKLVYQSLWFCIHSIENVLKRDMY